MKQTKINGKVYYALIFVIEMIMLIGFGSGEQQSLGTFKQNTCVSLTQTCSNCTFVNITSIIAPNSQILAKNIAMTKSGTNYNYTFCNTTQLGTYIYNTIGDDDGIVTTQPVTFDINPSGNKSPLGLFIIVILITYSIAFIGFFGKNIWVSVIGGMGMVALGIYTINNGIDVYRTFITDVFSWTTIGIGAFFALYAGYSVIQEEI